MGNNWGTAGGAGGDRSVNQVILVTHSRNPPRVDGKMLLKEEAHNFLRAYDTYCRRTEDDRAAGVQCKLYNMSELLSNRQKDPISLFYFGRRGLTEEMLAEGVRKVVGVADSDAELYLGHLERDITRKLTLSPHVRMCDQAFAVQLKVQELLHDRNLSTVFVPNGRWVKRWGAIVARAILAGLTPPGFCDDVRRRVQLENARSDPYRVVQLMEEMSRNKWAEINEYQLGARSSGRGGWNQVSGDECRPSPRGEAHSSGAYERPIGEGCWSCGSTDLKKKKNYA